MAITDSHDGTEQQNEYKAISSPFGCHLEALGQWRFIFKELKLVDSLWAVRPRSQEQLLWDAQ